MKNWWLKLYTIPTLKRMLFLNALCVGADIFFTFFGFADFELVAVMYFVPIIYLWAKEMQQGFVRNLPFHKITLPFPEIKRALICHYSIVVPTTFIMASILCSASEALGGSAPGFKSLPAFSTFLTISLLVVVLTFSLLVASKNFHNIKIKIKANIIVQILFGVMGYFMIMLLGALLMIAKFDINIFMFIVGFGVILAAGLYKWRAMFHFVPAQITKKLAIKYYSAGMLCTFVMFCLLALVGRNDHQNYDFAAEERAARFMFWQPFSGSLDQTTFQELEPHVGAIYIEEFYALAPKNISEIPIQNFIDAKNPNRVMWFVAFGKPSKKNLEFMASHLERNKAQWEKIDPKQKVAHVLASNWPKGMPVPDSLVEFKVKRERAIASQAPKTQPRKSKAEEVIFGDMEEPKQ